MLELLFGILVGIFLKPIAWCFCVSLLRSRLDAPYRNRPKQTGRHTLSETQVSLCRAALHQCNDLDWFNVFVQRYFTVAVRSYAFNERIKSMIMKKVAPFLQYRLVRRVEILSIDLGSEFPVTRSMRVLDESELDEVLVQYNVREEVEDDYGEEGAQQRQADGAEDPSNAQKSEAQHVYSRIFRHCLLLADMSFSGRMVVRTEIEVPGGIVYGLSIVMERFDGKVLFRIPARAHQTRFEATFVSNPNFEVSIAPLGDGGSESLRGFFVKYFRKMFVYGLSSAVQYPSWNSFYLPLVCPSFRDIEHRVEKVTLQNCSEVAKNIRHRILLYTSMDYKIIKRSFRFQKRRIQYLVNGKDRIFRYEFPTPEEMPSAENTAAITMFPGLSAGESALLAGFYDWTGLEGVLGGFVGLKTVKKIDAHTSLVLIYFSEEQYQFLRIKGDDFVIFQSSDPGFPEFVLFQIRDNVFYIYQYGLRKDLVFSDSRVLELVKKISGEQPRALGSERLHSIFSFSRRGRRSTRLSIGHRAGADACMEISPEDVQRLFAECDAYLGSSADELHVKEVDMAMGRAAVMAILRDDICRFQLLRQNTSVIGISRTSDTSYTSLVSDQGGSDLVVHTLVGDSLIADTGVDSSDVLQCFRVEERSEDTVRIRIFSKEPPSQMCVLGFLNHLNLLQRYNEMRTIASTRPSEEVWWRGLHDRTLACTTGAMYVEITTDTGALAVLSAALNTRQNYVLRKMPIAPGRTCRFVFSTEEGDRVTISLSSKQDSMQRSMLRLHQLPEKFHRDELVDCEVVLGSKKTVQVSVPGCEHSHLFWRVPACTHITMELKSDGETVSLVNPGIVPSTPARRTFTFANTGRVPAAFPVYLGIAKLP